MVRLGELKTGLRTFLLPRIVPGYWDYICEVSWARRVPVLVQLWGTHREGTVRIAGVVRRQSLRLQSLVGRVKQEVDRRVFSI